MSKARGGKCGLREVGKKAVAEYKAIQINMANDKAAMILNQLGRRLLSFPR